tara:strand:+ start:2499 stop:3182 length:684 start_codon:yes stop_codon:yes gene_type:complete
MSIHITFYKPVDYFSGLFNRFAAWLTWGDYCHCELVVKTSPTEIMNTVKEIYQAAQKGNYAPEDCNRIISQIEMAFFDTGFRKLAQSSDTLTLSFSQILGQKMAVRSLTKTAHDTWFKLPTGEDNYVDIADGPQITEKQRTETLRFAIEELGKDYDTSGALCSWLPFSSSHRADIYETWFCSEFVVTAFQRIGFAKSLDAKRTTPNSLYHFVKDGFASQSINTLNAE